MSNTQQINKEHIINEIFNISREKALGDYHKLPKNCNELSKIKPLSIIGNDFINYFTSMQRLNTIGNKGISFWYFYEHKDEFIKKQYIRNVYEYCNKNQPSLTDTKIWYRIFNMYFGSINIFKATIAMNIYCKYKPKSILDFTMGWGGRLIGACALNIEKYTGIDLNTELKTPYSKMVKMLKPLSSTNIKLIFKDALKVDYSKIDYDMVLTSPPYYNIELYNGTEKKTKKEWNNNFYKPLITKTFKYLKKNGYYCLNINNEIYENICIQLLGNAHELIPLTKVKRTNNEKYNEYIYVWKK